MKPGAALSRNSSTSWKVSGSFYTLRARIRLLERLFDCEGYCWEGYFYRDFGRTVVSVPTEAEFVNEVLAET